MARYITINKEAGSATFEMVFSITIFCLVMFLISEFMAFFISSHKSLIMADGAINARLSGTSNPCLESFATDVFGGGRYTVQLPDVQVGWGVTGRRLTPSSTVTFVVENICN